MMNAPTKSEMIAKISSRVLKNDKLPFTSLDCSFANCSPVIAWYGNPSLAERACDAIAHLYLREARISAHVDLVPLTDAVHHFLRGRWDEGGKRGSREAVLLATEFHDPGDGELAGLDREERDLGAFAELELPVGERLLVERDLVRRAVGGRE